MNKISQISFFCVCCVFQKARLAGFDSPALKTSSQWWWGAERSGRQCGGGKLETWDDITSPAPSHDVMYHNNKEKAQVLRLHGPIISVCNSRREAGGGRALLHHRGNARSRLGNEPSTEDLPAQPPPPLLYLKLSRNKRDN